MQQDRLRWAIIGPIIGFILLYFVLRFAVTQFSADRHALGEFGVATISEVQEMEAAANAEEATVEGETADGEAVAEGEATADGEAAVDGEAAT
ncbi:MAG: hypothetical protein KDD78_12140, partial [Caldilineaceae bacterium]|nr:hypothetical protein [Caldilineaceae bacterium]